MRKLFSRLSVLLMLVPLLFVAACSDDDDSPVTASTGTTSQAAATTTQAASTTQAAAVTQSETTTGGATSEAALTGSVKVDFTGSPEELPALEMAFEVAAGSTAWDAIKAALGEENVTYQDFGGDLGVFITGFKGVDAEGNHFWEFRPNGESAEIGVSKYEVQDGDVLEFAYSSF